MTDQHFLFFPDNTVLNNFAIMHLMDELAQLIGDRGRWCATVAEECAKGARIAGLEDMERAAEIFGPALYPDSAELIDIQVLREHMLTPGDSASAHLGEAETIAIMSRRKLPGFFVTDDRNAARGARAQQIRVLDTWVILRLMTRTHRLSVDDFHRHCQTLVDAHRGHPPHWPNTTAIELWLFS